MRKILSGVFCVLLTVAAYGQNDPLSIFDGIWVSVNPPGPHVVFNKVGLGTREASLPVVGQASIRVSNGENGSNFLVSGEGFSCQYFVGKVNNREMTWELKGGSSTCFPSADFKKDPP
jgi:hypothetical protein